MQPILEVMPNDQDLESSIKAHTGCLSDPLIEILVDMLRLIAEYEEAPSATERVVQLGSVAGQRE
jgi:hypothetical protein